ncbi:hypothetical protein FB451DRAFT_1364545 [Mycena latifolia]|nr:hypothetical protein FB451DRAFT_1364545 [Mycena latifolia]
MSDADDERRLLQQGLAARLEQLRRDVQSMNNDLITALTSDSPTTVQLTAQLQPQIELLHEAFPPASLARLDLTRNTERPTSSTPRTPTRLATRKPKKKPAKQKKKTAETGLREFNIGIPSVQAAVQQSGAPDMQNMENLYKHSQRFKNVELSVASNTIDTELAEEYKQWKKNYLRNQITPRTKIAQVYEFTGLQILLDPFWIPANLVEGNPTEFRPTPETCDTCDM